MSNPPVLRNLRNRCEAEKSQFHKNLKALRNRRVRNPLTGGGFATTHLGFVVNQFLTNCGAKPRTARGAKNKNLIHGKNRRAFHRRGGCADAR